MRFLLIDDDEQFRRRLARALAARGHDVAEARCAEDVIERPPQPPPERAIVDLRMGGRSGIEAIRALRRLDPAPQCLVLTGYGSIVTAVEAMRCGALDYLTKPVDADDILAAFDTAGDETGPSCEHPVPTLDRVEWEHIQRVLYACGGNVSRAARELGLHRRTLQRKLAIAPPRR